jgi:RNA-directed DNA polymerase
VTVDAFEQDLEAELARLKQELERWSYKPKPVRRVEIPKPGKDAGVRLLGVPCVRDRVVQATLKLILEPILDPGFSDNSYGFRPGRNQRQAVIFQCLRKLPTLFAVNRWLRAVRLPCLFRIPAIIASG